MKNCIPSFSLKSDSTLFRTPINICYNYVKLKDFENIFFELFIKESHKKYAEINPQNIKNNVFFLREKYANYLKTNFRKKKDCIFMHKKFFLA